MELEEEQITIARMQYENGVKVPIPIWACEIGQWSDWLLTGAEENVTQTILRKFADHLDVGKWVKKAVSQGASFSLAERWIGATTCVLIQHHNLFTLKSLLREYFAIYGVKPKFNYFP
jgi:hypothetical protein